MRNNFKYSYGFRFYYRKTKESDPITDCFFFDSNDSDSENACTICMLNFLKKNNYYSGKIIKIINC